MMIRFLFPLLLLVLPSCQSFRKAGKAKPAGLSGFLTHRSELQRSPAGEAFHYTWSSPEWPDPDFAAGCTGIYVAPVSLNYLRPMMEGRLRGTAKRGETVSPMAAGLAAEIPGIFAGALEEYPGARFRAAAAPGPHTLVLEMALTELNHTSPGANAATLAAKLALGPAGHAARLAVQASGNIAVEGRLRAGKNGRVIYEFADNEKDKATLYSFRDFSVTGHAKAAAADWAKQFAALVNGPHGRKVKDSKFWTLSIF